MNTKTTNFELHSNGSFFYNDYMKRLNGNQLVRQIIIFLSVLIMCRACVLGVIFPFGVAFSFALVACKRNPLLIAIYYFASSMILDFSIVGFVINFCVSVGMVFIFVLQKFTRKSFPSYVISLVMLVSQSAKVYFGLGSAEEILITAVEVLVGFVAYFVFFVSLGALIKRGKKLRFTIDEKICHAVTVVAGFSGMANLMILKFNCTILFCIFLFFIGSRITSASVIITASVLAGVGIGLSSSSVSAMAIFCVWTVVMTTFSTNKRLFVAIMVFASDVALGCFLNAYGVYDFWAIAPVFVGLLAGVLIPEKVIKKLNCMFGKKVGIIENYARVITEKDVRDKILDMSKVFSQMESVYKTLLIGPIDKVSAVDVIVPEVIKKTCRNCENYKRCHAGELDMASAYKVMVHAGVNKGKVSLVDVPSLIGSECVKIQSVVSCANAVISGFNFLVEETKEKDKSNLQVANQLEATAQLLEKLARNYSRNLKFDDEKSADLYDELLFHEVKICEVMCLCGNSGIDSIVVLIENADVLNPNLTFCMNKLFSMKFSIVERKMCDIAGFSILVAKPCGNFELVSGISTVSKECGADSGDSYTVTKISGNKYLYAISDGMGSGKSAQAISVATISLIENFYRAGFASDTIIDSVNKLLLPAGDENFACLDAAIIDAESGRIDFIKIGASVSVIKGCQKSRLIECESLPLGIIGQISPTAETIYAENQDIVVIASDGIVDSFSSPEAFLNFVNSERISSPQLLADSIMEEAFARRRGEKDDMTVLVIKMIQK